MSAYCHPPRGAGSSLCRSRRSAITAISFSLTASISSSSAGSSEPRSSADWIHAHSSSWASRSCLAVSLERSAFRASGGWIGDNGWGRWSGDLRGFTQDGLDHLPCGAMNWSAAFGPQLFGS